MKRAARNLYLLALFAAAWLLGVWQGYQLAQIDYRQAFVRGWFERDRLQRIDSDASVDAIFRRPAQNGEAAAGLGGEGLQPAASR